MKFSDLKKGMRVSDRWYPDWGIGVVLEVKKTVAKIRFCVKGEMKFDKPHIQFLEKV